MFSRKNIYQVHHLSLQPYNCMLWLSLPHNCCQVYESKVYKSSTNRTQQKAEKIYHTVYWTLEKTCSKANTKHRLTNNINHLGTKNVCTKFCANPSCRCWDTYILYSSVKNVALVWHMGINNQIHLLGGYFSPEPSGGPTEWPALPFPESCQQNRLLLPHHSSIPMAI